MSKFLPKTYSPRPAITACRRWRTAPFFKQAGARPYVAGLYDTYEDASRSRRLFLTDKKGGDLAELPADLRVREVPR